MPSLVDTNIKAVVPFKLCCMIRNLTAVASVNDTTDSWQRGIARYKVEPKLKVRGHNIKLMRITRW